MQTPGRPKSSVARDWNDRMKSVDTISPAPDISTSIKTEQTVPLIHFGLILINQSLSKSSKAAT